MIDDERFHAEVMVILREQNDATMDLLRKLQRLVDVVGELVNKLDQLDLPRCDN